MYACMHIARVYACLCVWIRMVLQCVAVCCSVLQCAAVCCSVVQCVALCCSVLQCVVVCMTSLHVRVLLMPSRITYCPLPRVGTSVAVHCSVLQCIAVCTLCCSVFYLPAATCRYKFSKVHSLSNLP